MQNYDHNNYAKLQNSRDLINTYQIVSNRKLIFTRGSVLHIYLTYLSYIFIKHRVTVTYIENGKSHDIYNFAIVFDLGLCNVFYWVQKLAGSVRETVGFT